MFDVLPFTDVYDKAIAWDCSRQHVVSQIRLKATNILVGVKHDLHQLATDFSGTGYGRGVNVCKPLCVVRVRP